MVKLSFRCIGICVWLAELQVFGFSRSCVVGAQCEGLLWARFDTVAASNAQQAVNRPFLLCAVHNQSAGRTFLGADGAIDAGCLGENQMPARAGQGTPRLEGIAAGRRLGECPLEGQAGDFKKDWKNLAYGTRG